MLQNLYRSSCVPINIGEMAERRLWLQMYGIWSHTVPPLHLSTSQTEHSYLSPISLEYLKTQNIRNIAFMEETLKLIVNFHCVLLVFSFEREFGTRMKALSIGWESSLPSKKKGIKWSPVIEWLYDELISRPKL